jgi:hypothetical protein
MRSLRALQQGRIIAEQRRGFYRAIKSWSNADLHAGVIRYRMQALQLPRAERFYAVRIRALNHEIRARVMRNNNRMRVVR